MKEYTVTGIRYQMGDNLSYEERTERAQRFVEALEMGTEVMLVAEPENPMDNRAVAVYIDYERIGYIEKEEKDEVRTLLDENQRGKGVVVRKDNHITFFISISGAPEHHIPIGNRPRVLPDCPLGETVRIPFTKAESALPLIANDLLSLELTKENMPVIMKLLERYVPHVKNSICFEDNQWLTRIFGNLMHAWELYPEMNLAGDITERLVTIFNKVRAAVGDIHRTEDHWTERIFKRQLDALRSDERVTRHLYPKYCEAFLDGKDFSKADKLRLRIEYDRLKTWLKGMRWSELRNPRQLDAMALRVNYLDLSREELYELYAVLLLLEQLEAVMSFTVDRNIDEIVSQLKPIFFGLEYNARSFLEDAMKMKPKEITDRVNQLVDEGIISELSRKRDLWKVLHDNGIYDKSESNWNLQVK